MTPKHRFECGGDGGSFCEHMCIMPGAAFDGELRICSHLQINSVPPVNPPLPTPNPRAFRTLSHPSHHRRPYPRRRGRVGGGLLRLGCGHCGVSGAGRPSFVLGVDVSCGAGYICGLSRGSSNASSQRRSMFLATGQAPLRHCTGGPTPHLCTQSWKFY